MPGISRVIGPKAKNQQIFKSLKCGLRYLCVIAFFQQLDEICQIATTLIITVSSWHYTLASFWRYKAKIKILFFCEPSLWVEVSNYILISGFDCAYRASRGCNQQIFIRGDGLPYYSLRWYTKSDFETGKGCVFNEQNLPVSKTHSLVIKPQEVNFKWSQNGNRPAKSRLGLLVRGHTKQLLGFVVVRWGYRCYFTVKIDQQI